jgi:hypothetical protein
LSSTAAVVASGSRLPRLHSSFSMGTVAGAGLGLLAEHVGILHSLLPVTAVLVASFLLSPVARKLP